MVYVVEIVNNNTGIFTASREGYV